MFMEDRIDLDEYNDFYMWCNNIGKYLESYFLTQVTVEGLYVHLTDEKRAQILKAALERTKSQIDTMIKSIEIIG